MWRCSKLSSSNFLASQRFAAVLTHKLIPILNHPHNWSPNEVLKVRMVPGKTGIAFVEFETDAQAATARDTLQVCEAFLVVRGYLCRLLPLILSNSFACGWIKDRAMSSERHSIAFLFLTMGEVKNPLAWEAWFQKAPRDVFDVHVHAKFEDDVRHPLFKNNLIPAIKTKWGTISLVQAHLLLLKKALENEGNRNYSTLSVVHSQQERCGHSSQSRRHRNLVRGVPAVLETEPCQAQLPAGP
eukprot:764506-Hanusia_phi.AAC.2